jgi:hypothetical protein
MGNQCTLLNTCLHASVFFHLEDGSDKFFSRKNLTVLYVREKKFFELNGLRNIAVLGCSEANETLFTNHR